MLRENHFHKDQIGISSSKLTPNFKNALLLSAYFYSMVQVMQKIAIKSWSVLKLVPKVACGAFY